MRAVRMQLGLMCVLFAFLATGADTPTPPPAVPSGMVLVPGGVYQPPVRASSGSNTVAVASFCLDVYPVTNEGFLEFVRQNPAWRRSQVSRSFAEAGYLRHWAGDLEPGPQAPTNAPVTNISWFAARAYARWKGQRLPTTAEWELVAAHAVQSEGQDRSALQRHILDWYATPSPAVLPPVGSALPNGLGLHDLHGLVWEWVSDFSRFQTADRDGRPLGGDVFCGGGSMNAVDPSDYAAFVRFGFRSSLRPEYVVHNLGFRCARSVDAGITQAGPPKL